MKRVFIENLSVDAVIARSYNKFPAHWLAERHASALQLFKRGVFYQFAR